MESDLTMSDNVFRNITIDWKQPTTWVSYIDVWLTPYLNEHRIEKLKGMGRQNLCIDDPAWLEEILQSAISDQIEEITDDLAVDIEAAFIRSFHGCRVKDATSFHEEGIRLNDPSVLADQVRAIVNEEPELKIDKARVESLLSKFDSWDRDTNRLYLSVDERGLIDDAGHYLLYGSEWIQCVLGWGAHRVMRKRGVPTIIDVRLPLRTQSRQTRNELASKILHEWTRLTVDHESEVWKIDFSFILRDSIPASWVISHHHPTYVNDPFYQRIRRTTQDPWCPACDDNVISDTLPD